MRRCEVLNIDWNGLNGRKSDLLRDYIRFTRRVVVNRRLFKYNVSEDKWTNCHNDGYKMAACAIVILHFNTWQIDTCIDGIRSTYVSNRLSILIESVCLCAWICISEAIGKQQIPVFITEAYRMTTLYQNSKHAVCICPLNKTYAH